MHVIFKFNLSSETLKVYLKY